MNLKALQIAAALSVVFVSTSAAGIVGSTYNFSASGQAPTSVTATNGTYTDPANPGFCVTPGAGCGVNSGISGSFSFADNINADPTHSTITFQFFGSTDPTTGSFKIDLGNFATTDGSTITGVTYHSGNLNTGDFSNVTWTGTDAVFQGTPNGNFDAVGGSTVIFDVAVTSAAPEPASMFLGGLGLLGLSLAAKRRRA